MSGAPTQRPTRYAVGPVDYEAWRNGYMPPSEHILIDQLAYRGARVVLSCDSGNPDGPAYWLVVRGKTNPTRIALALARLLETWEEEELGLAPESPAEPSASSPSKASAGNPPPDEPPSIPPSGAGEER